MSRRSLITTGDYLRRADTRRVPAASMWSESPLRPEPLHIRPPLDDPEDVSVIPGDPPEGSHWYANDLVLNTGADLGTQPTIPNEFWVEDGTTNAPPSSLVGVGTIRHFLAYSARGVGGISMDPPWTRMLIGHSGDWEFGLYTCEGVDDFTTYPWRGTWSTVTGGSRDSVSGQYYISLHTTHRMFAHMTRGQWRASLAGQADSAYVDFTAMPYPFGFQLLFSRAFYSDWVVRPPTENTNRIMLAAGGTQCSTNPTRPNVGTASSAWDDMAATLATYGNGYGGYIPPTGTYEHKTIGAYGLPSWAMAHVGWTPT